MKSNAKSPRRLGWLRAWAIQIAASLLAGALASGSLGLHATLYGLLLWIAVPLAGAFTACRAVLGGLNNYLAWLAPPACLYAAHYLIWRYAPPAGPALVCAFVSLVGAAAGEVLKAR